MKIAFDGQLLLGGNKTGIAWMAHNLILELAKYPENECTIQFFNVRHKKDRLQNLEIYKEAGCRLKCCRWFHSVLYKFIWPVIPVPYSFFFKSKPDIMQFFNYAVPPGVNGKRITFIYDMAYRSCPQTMSRKTRNWLRFCMKKSCKHADHIITISQFSKSEIQKYLQIPSEQITVIPSAVDHTKYHTHYTEGQIQNVLDKYQIDREYILYLGTIEPRKNLERLIGAYEKLCQVLRKEQKEAPQLVLAGGRGWLCDGIYQKAREAETCGRILFTGYVAPKDSPVLMCGAAVFVFPSLYEGFGMPPLEAMACGTPVITSNTSSLPEVVQDAGITVDPGSEEEICAAMRMLLEDQELRRKLRVLGVQRAAGYTWEKSAEMLMDVYYKLM